MTKVLAVKVYFIDNKELIRYFWLEAFTFKTTLLRKGKRERAHLVVSCNFKKKRDQNNISKD